VRCEMAKYIHVLLGGMQGPDGFLDSAGIEFLALRLAPLGIVRTYPWSEWERAGEAISSTQVGTKIGANTFVLIGYSGGGSRATWLVDKRFDNAISRPMIDLLITLDPSPEGDMRPIRTNVLRVVNFHNKMQDLFWPGIGKLGGGRVTGARVVEEVEINMPHLAVQADVGVHEKVIELVEGVGEGI
jgi:hypothetical protein